MRALCLNTLAGTLAYGFTFGIWRSPVQAVYSALKMPLLFFSTVLNTALINTILAQLLGAKLSFKQVCMTIITGMAITAIIMGALTPIVLFFVMQAPSPSPLALFSSAADPDVVKSMKTYWAMLLIHVGVMGISGIIGNIRLFKLLKHLTTSTSLAIKLMIIWIGIIGFVGCELSWLLSPFLCKPTQLPHIIPKEYFEQNFYERVWQAIMELTKK